MHNEEEEEEPSRGRQGKHAEKMHVEEEASRTLSVPSRFGSGL
jgi:hypothetical protein